LIVRIVDFESITDLQATTTIRTEENTIKNFFMIF
jgi:hypothetical protein